MVGLRNLGNTCYLNASIQCLSNSRLLREYFTGPTKMWTRDLNCSSAAHEHGMAGKMASRLLILYGWRNGERVERGRRMCVCT